MKVKLKIEIANRSADEFQQDDICNDILVTHRIREMFVAKFNEN